MTPLIERFIKYVKFETTSDENTGVTPSTPTQMVFAKELKKDLEEMGLSEVSLDDNLSLPLSALNNLRRDALLQLDTARATVHRYEIFDVSVEPPKPFRPASRGLRARVPKTKLGRGFKACELVFVPLFADVRAALGAQGYRHLELQIPEAAEEAQAFWNAQGFSPTSKRDDTGRYPVITLARDI